MKNCDYSTREFGKKCKSNNAATKIARVKYNSQEQDAFYLCDKCADLLNREANANHWQLTIRDFEQSS